MAKPPITPPSKGKSVRGGRHQPQPPYLTNSSHINGGFILEFCHGLWHLHYSRSCTLPLRLRAPRVLEDSRGLYLDSRRASSKQPLVVLAPRKAATGERAQLKGEERKSAKDYTSTATAAAGGRRTVHGRGAGLQPYSLASYLLLQPSSARTSRHHHARRSKLRLQTLYRPGVCRR